MAGSSLQTVNPVQAADMLKRDPGGKSAGQDPAPQPARASLLPEDLLSWLIVGSLVFSAATFVFVLLAPDRAGAPGLIYMAGTAILALIVILAVLSNRTSPELLWESVWRRPGRAMVRFTGGFAGHKLLERSGVTLRVLNTDPEPLAVTRRDGAMMFANTAYRDLAREAGVTGPAGLTPRVDRLFAQKEEGSSALFRLCQGALTGRDTEEMLSQTFGATGAPLTRRYSISARPLKGETELILWRFREAPRDDREVKARMRTLNRVPDPVFRLTAEDQLDWANRAAHEQFADGLRRGRPALDVLFEGEDSEISSFLEAAKDAEPAPLTLRRASDGSQWRLETFALDDSTFVRARPSGDDGEDGDLEVGDPFADAPFGVAVIEGDAETGRIAESNKAVARLLGANSAKNVKLSDFFDAETLAAISNRLKKRGRKSKDDLAPIEAHPKANDNVLHLYVRTARRKRGQWGGRRVLLYMIDATTQKQLETQHAQGQKMQAIGQLAGGVAHDFNNILTVIIGNCDMLMTRHAVGDPSYPDLVQIQQNANRAAALVRKLLAFSRKQTLQPKVLSVSEVLHDFTPFLKRTITERVELNIEHGADLPQIKVDKSQLEIVLMNLAVNARDAMGEGGRLTFRSSSVTRARLKEFNYPMIEPADYLLLEVSDTGHGVPADIVDNIFEPFFTTKEAGKGTGLGLSTVYGIVRQTGGYIFLESAPGRGATFRVFLPAHDPANEISLVEDAGVAVSEDLAPAVAEANAPGPNAAKPQGQTDTPVETLIETKAADLTGRGKILVVEDEDAVRSFVVRALETRGYEVIEACDGEEGLEVIEAHQGEIDLLLSDVMMPSMDGPTMVEQALDKLGEAKIIFMSGYAEDAMREQIADAEQASFLAKPFSLKILAERVKETLSS